MPSPNARKRILREFPPEKPGAWRTRALELLGEAAFQELLERETAEGVPLAPIYRAEDLAGLRHQEAPPGFAPFTRGNSAFSERGWWVAQEMGEDESLLSHDAQTLEVLREEEIIHLVLALPSRLGNSSLSIDELETILGGAETASAAVFLDAGALSLQPLAVLGAYWQRLGLASENWQGAIAADPLGALARDGELPQSLAHSFDELAATTTWCAKHAPEMGTIWCHGEVWHDGGAHAAQELGLALAAVVASLRELQERGVDPSTAAAHLHWSFAIGSTFFTEIAKLRAARMLLSRVLSSCGVKEQNCHAPLHARTSRRSLTRQQPHLNLLRTTSEAFSAAVGGADSIHVDGFDAALPRETAFARRLARNLQYILKDEARVADVMDPGGGSYYIERMTAKLAARSWQILQEVEASGGLESALREGSVQARIASTHREELEKAELGRLVRIGINKYPAARAPDSTSTNDTPPVTKRQADSRQNQEGRDPKRVRAAESTLAGAVSAAASSLDPEHAETLVEAALQAAAARMSFSELSIVSSRGGSESSAIEAIPLRREAAPFEDFRDRVEAARAKGKRLRVLPINLGRDEAYASGLAVAVSLLEVGGFEVLPGQSGDDRKAALQAIEKSGASILLLCAADADDSKDTQALIRELKTSQPESIVVVAASPEDPGLRARLKKAGVEVFLHGESPILATLQLIAQRLGVD